MAYLKITLLLLLTTGGFACIEHSNRAEKKSPSEAGAALSWWHTARSFPDGIIHTEKYTKALDDLKSGVADRGGFNPLWTAIGPKNIGGRTLCLAIHPQDTNMMWAGSASGGIWKTTTAGIGANAWQYVETGFPVLGVSAIAIDPKNPDVLYAGTGEVYNSGNSAPNVAFRTTRGTYGIGILKTTNGGTTWSKSLDWSYGQLRGVQDIKINPLRTATVYAATTEGLLRSYDAGATWKTVNAVKMAVDIEILASDTNRIFVTHGSLDDQAISGIYRSDNGGASFKKLAGGLPATYSGKAMIATTPLQAGLLYASIGNAFAQEGLYKTTDYGDTWQRVSLLDVCSYQGWYSHDVALHATLANNLIWVGIDAFKSTNGGVSNTRKSNWNAWYFGYVPAGGPEGPRNYVHADIHRVYYADRYPNKVYMVTDGGIFVSYNNGESFQGRNGGYQTQQFYANMGYSTTNPKWAIGGMQDNSTAIYKGDPSWTRVIGGDGECAAISPVNDQILYASTQYLGMYRSSNGGQNFSYIVPSEISDEDPCFNGPFELAPSEPATLYAGAQSLFQSKNSGTNWTNVSGGFVANGDYILTIAVHPKNPELVWFSTVPVQSGNADVYKMEVKTGTKTQMQGLPNRYCMDIALHPSDEKIAYAAFAGFNTRHIFKTTDGGLTWKAADAGLPDVPTNTLLIDPLQPNHIYAGNDLGVWVSLDAGNTWNLYSGQAPKSMLVMHLGISADRKLCVATHGLGVWQTDMVHQVVRTNDPEKVFNTVKITPNPVLEQPTLHFDLSAPATVDFAITDVYGRVLQQTQPEKYQAGNHQYHFSVAQLPPGIYQVILTAGENRHSCLFLKI